MEITVFIPARNEADCVGATVDAAWRIEGVTRVVVIDDCSSDSTRCQALLAGATVVSLESHRGKGGALMAGLHDSEFDYCLFLDADLGESAEQGVLLLAPVVCGELDMAIARFPRPARTAGFGQVKKLALDAIHEASPSFECLSPLSGQRAFTRDCIRSLLPLADGYGMEVALTVKALRGGFRVAEVETQMHHKLTGNDPAGYVHRLKQYIDVKRAVSTL